APWTDPDPEAVRDALLEGIAREGVGALPWDRETRQLQERLVFLHRLDPAWPDVSDAALAAALPEWLGPHVHGLRRVSDLRPTDVRAALLALLPWDRRQALDELAPTHLAVPSGSRITIDYSDPEAPVLAVRLQEVFGLTRTPRLARGRVPLTLHLLSPAGRPVQVTRDLESFWRSTYFEVKKDLKGRYPKHYWPDDPLTATPTHRVRPRG
ncbi:MAG: ATP-dependent helicase HrpB, partial [Gemmatimonadota bacterium]|nr:ATP-dependent helicase HrpB [Gemmatimonadota bacterium]